MPLRHINTLTYSDRYNISDHMFLHEIAYQKKLYGRLAMGSYVGLPANIFLVYISLWNKQKINDYKICLMNTALLDICFCIISLVRYYFLEELVHHGDGMHVMECSINNWLLIVPGMAMLYALPVVCKKYQLVVVGVKEY